MSEINLRFPITVGETSISSVTPRPPTGRDMVALADHLPALVELAEKAQAGDRFIPNKATFEAMVAIVGIVTGIGIEAAGELAFVDISSIVADSSGFLEAALSEAAPTTGGSPSPSQLPN